MWAFLWWVFVYVGIPAGLAYLGGRLLAPDEPEPDDDLGDGGGQSTNWNPRSTQSEGMARPHAYGENMHHGNIVSRWTDVDGNNREILYLILEHGDGPTEGIGANLVYLNDQPAGNFGSVTVQERLGTMDLSLIHISEPTRPY